MLQQILQTMHIDPELLEKLSDDDRLLLFAKMRLEQVRRWEAWQAELEETEKKRRKPKLPPKPGTKRVHFLLGSDGNPWTWVIDDVSASKDSDLDEVPTKGPKSDQETVSSRGISFGDEGDDTEDHEVRVTLSRAKLLAQILEQNSVDKERTNWLKRKQDKLKTKQPLTTDNRNGSEIPEVQQVFTLLRNTQKKASDMQDTIRRSVEGTQLVPKDSETSDRETDSMISEIARRARVLLSAKSATAAANKRNNFMSQVPRSTTLPITRTKNRLGKPPSRASIVEWFRSEERPRGAGWDPESNTVAPWFHGMVTRQEAEEMLAGQPMGTFLVRFCERMWGYVLSYRAADRCKHTMIDSSNGNYQFLDGGLRKFHKLKDLVQFCHSTTFASDDGERLVMPCPKSNNEQIFKELFA